MTLECSACKKVIWNIYELYRIIEKKGEDSNGVPNYEFVPGIWHKDKEYKNCGPVEAV